MTPSTPIHAYLNVVKFQQACEFLARELASLIGVKDRRRSVLGNGFIECLHTEVCRQRIG